jgi:hypothetical protein
MKYEIVEGSHTKDIQAKIDKLSEQGYKLIQFIPLHSGYLIAVMGLDR